MHYKKTLKSYYHIIYPVFLVAFLTIGVAIVVVQSQKNQTINTEAAITNCKVDSEQLAIKPQEQRLLYDINMYRTQQGLTQLTWNTTLKQSAVWQTNDMQTHNTLSHTDSLGRTTDIRLSDCGYDIADGYGENIAQDTSTDADLVFNAWKNNQEYKQILLNKSYTIAGIDMEQSVSGNNVFWTMDFGGNSITGKTAENTAFSVSTAPSISPSLSPSISPSTDQLSPAAEPVAQDMLISVSVKIVGIGQGGNIFPKHLTRKVTVSVYGTDTTPVTTGTGFLNYDGSNYFTGTIHLGELSQGSYLVKIGAENTLQVIAQPAFQKLLIGQTNTIPLVTLYQGDINADNVLDINDYNEALPCFQTNNCSNTSLDFNDDGQVNVIDYNLLLQSYEVLHGD
jgi:uncharacterized protein YkwD